MAFLGNLTAPGLPFFVGGSAQWPPKTLERERVSFVGGGVRPSFLAVPTKDALPLAAMRSICVSMEFWGVGRRGKRIDPNLLILETDGRTEALAALTNLLNLMAPPVADAPRTIRALRWVVAELNRRKRLMDSVGVRTSSQFNWLLDIDSADTLLSFAVVISDYGTLMRRAQKECEPLLFELGKAGAAGIHLFCFITQEDLADGRIVHSEIRNAFTVECVNDMENLNAAMAEDVTRRLQGMSGLPNYNKRLMKTLFPEESQEDASLSSKEGAAARPLYERAVEVVCKTRRASASHLQRRLGIGFNEAARLIDQLETRGVIGPKRPGWLTREILNPTQTTKQAKE